MRPRMRRGGDGRRMSRCLGESPVLAHFTRCVGGISAAMDDAVEAIIVERNERIDEANDTD